jgi:hypothetical protein
MFLRNTAATSASESWNSKTLAPPPRSGSLTSSSGVQASVPYVRCAWSVVSPFVV